MIEPKEALLKIFEIVGYNDDREAMAMEFMALSINRAVLEILNTLSLEDQDKLRGSLQEVKDQVKIGEAIAQFVNKELFAQTLKKTFAITITEYLNTIRPHLTIQQKYNLGVFLEEQMNEEYKIGSST